MRNDDRFLIVLSGGFDSAYLAKYYRELSPNSDSAAISFNYGQKHVSELDCATKLAERLKLKHQTVSLEFLKNLTSSALTDESISDELRDEKGRFNVIVPGRNALLARLAATWGKKLGINRIVLGINATDAPEFPDCSRGYFDQLQELFRVDLMAPSIVLETPLAGLTKAQLFKDCENRGWLQELLDSSISCYRGLAGKGCEKCPACLAKKEGLEAAGLSQYW